MYEASYGPPPRPAVAGQRSHELWTRVGKWLSDDYSFKRGLTFGVILAIALGAFEIFNFSTTEFALQDLLGEARFLGLQWATILAIAFCGIDFAGLARLFTPERRDPISLEVWYLVGAWFLGATMNAMMTWWAVSLTMINHTVGNEVLSREQLLTYVPIFVAALVWLTRILIIGTFSVAGERLFARARAVVREARRVQQQQWNARHTRGAPAVARRSPKPSRRPARDAVSHVRARQAVPARPTNPQPTSEKRPPPHIVGSEAAPTPSRRPAPTARELRYESLDEEEAAIQVRPAPKPPRASNGIRPNGARSPG